MAEKELIKCPMCKQLVEFEEDKDGKLCKCLNCGYIASKSELNSALRKPIAPSLSDDDDKLVNKAVNKEREAVKDDNEDSFSLRVLEDVEKEEAADAAKKQEEEEEAPAVEEKAAPAVDTPVEEEEEEVTPVEENPADKEEILEEQEEIMTEMEEEEEEPVIDFPCGPSEDIKDRTALFYEIYTTYEDADPYLDDELLVVCDGCGGAGSSKHLLKKEHMGSYEAIKELVLPEDVNDCLKPQLDILYKPILEAFKGGDTQYRTSAFIGSRLVLPRYIYAFKKYKNEEIPFEEKLGKIKNFVEKGMRNEIATLDLEKDLVGRKALLSTTFVSVIFNGNPDEDELIDVDVIWAGDSRAYVLYPTGLRKLIQDDEDNAGALTNLFCIKEGRKIEIRHRHYKLQKPCIIFTCSDGVFDAFQDNLSLDCTLTQFMQDCNSLQEFADHLKNDAYSYIKSDDCTMAMRMFGFKDYDEMKKAYLPRFEQDKKLIELKNKFKPYLELKNDPSALRECVDMLVQRLENGAILSDVAKTIADELKKGNFDDPYTEHLKPLYEQYLEDKEAIVKQIREAKIEVIDKVAEYILEGDNYYKCNYLQIFDLSKLEGETKKLFEKVSAEVHDYNLYVLESERNEKYKNYLNSCLTSMWNLIVPTFNRVKGILGLTDDCVNEEAKEAFIKEQIEKCLTEDLRTFFASVKGGQEAIDKTEQKILEYKDSLGKLNIYKEKEYDKIDCDAILEDVKKIFEGDEENKLALFKALFINNPDIAELTASYRSIDTSILEENALALRIYEKYEKVGGAKQLVDIRLASDKPTTIIDEVFNATFLRRALEYIACQKPNEEVKNFLKDFLEVEQKIEKLPEEA